MTSLSGHYHHGTITIMTSSWHHHHIMTALPWHHHHAIIIMTSSSKSYESLHLESYEAISFEWSHSLRHDSGSILNSFCLSFFLSFFATKNCHQFLFGWERLPLLLQNAFNWLKIKCTDIKKRTLKRTLHRKKIWHTSHFWLLFFLGFWGAMRVNCVLFRDGSQLSKVLPWHTNWNHQQVWSYTRLHVTVNPESHSLTLKQWTVTAIVTCQLD